jgi:hypothetical protein
MYIDDHSKSDQTESEPALIEQNKYFVEILDLFGTFHLK